MLTQLIALHVSVIIYLISEIVFLVILLVVPSAKRLMPALNANQLIRFQVQLVSLVAFPIVKTAVLIMFAKLVIITGLSYFPQALLEALAFNAVVFLIVFLVQLTICVAFV